MVRLPYRPQKLVDVIMVFGKILGAVLGFYGAGLFGAICGAAIGHMFDRGFHKAMRHDYQGSRIDAQQLFFQTVFRVMGMLAKADGRISEEEIANTEQMMTRFGLTPESRKTAILFFKQGAAPDFDLEAQIALYLRQGNRGQNAALLLELLIGIALADGELHAEEQVILSKVAHYLGVPAGQFQQLLDMLKAQAGFAGANGQSSGFDSNGGYTDSSRLSEAYKAIGVSEGCSDADLKKAYRKLMSQHHPDKLMAKGVPEDMIKMATAKSQEIQNAYDLIKRSRK